MLLTLDDQILNMNHVSRVFIKPAGGERFRAVAEYASSTYHPRTEKEGPRLREFTVELRQGSKEECQAFISDLATVWQSKHQSLQLRISELGIKMAGIIKR